MRELAVLLLLSGVMGCGPSVVGRACDSTDPCPAGFVCASGNAADPTRCMRECMLDETVCNDGTACLPIGSGTGACYLGGSVAIGQSCMYDTDCTRTAICIHGTFSSECRVGCNLDGTHPCSGSLNCQPAGGQSGYCASM